MILAPMYDAQLVSYSFWFLDEWLLSIVETVPTLTTQIPGRRNWRNDEEEEGKEDGGEEEDGEGEEAEDVEGEEEDDDEEIEKENAHMKPLLGHCPLHGPP